MPMLLTWGKPNHITRMNLLDRTVLALHPTVPGRVAEVRVQEGDYVSAGAVLFRMDDTLAR